MTRAFRDKRDPCGTEDGAAGGLQPHQNAYQPATMTAVIGGGDLRGLRDRITPAHPGHRPLPPVPILGSPRSGDQLAATSQHWAPTPRFSRFQSSLMYPTLNLWHLFSQRRKDVDHDFSPWFLAQSAPKCSCKNRATSRTPAMRTHRR